MTNLERLRLYSANEIKRQGCLIGQSISEYRAWELEGFLVIIKDDDNTVAAIFDVSQATRPWLNWVNPQEIGHMILIAAGVQ